MTFPSRGMPFKVMKPNAIYGGVTYIGSCRCRVRVVHRQGAEKGKRYEVRFPDSELEQIVPMEATTLVGYMEVKGNWHEHTGECIFHPVGSQG